MKWHLSWRLTGPPANSKGMWSARSWSRLNHQPWRQTRKQNLFRSKSWSQHPWLPQSTSLRGLSPCH